jgi:hypothetical protein
MSLNPFTLYTSSTSTRTTQNQYPTNIRQGSGLPRSNTGGLRQATQATSSGSLSSLGAQSSTKELREILRQMDQGFNGRLDLRIPLGQCDIGKGVHTESGATLSLLVNIIDGQIDISGKSKLSGIIGDITTEQKGRVALKRMLWKTPLSTQSVKCSNVKFTVNKYGNVIANINLRYAPNFFNKKLEKIGLKAQKLLDMKAVHVTNKKISVSDFYRALESQLKKPNSDKVPDLGKLIAPKIQIKVDIKGDWPSQLNNDVKKFANKHTLKQKPPTTQQQANPPIPDKKAKTLFPAKVDVTLDLTMNAPLSETGDWVSLSTNKSLDSTKATLNFFVDEKGLIDPEKSRVIFNPPLNVKVASYFNPIDIKSLELFEDTAGQLKLRLNADQYKILGLIGVANSINNQISKQITKVVAANFVGGVIHRDISKNSIKEDAKFVVSDNTTVSSALTANVETTQGNFKITTNIDRGIPNQTPKPVLKIDKEKTEVDITLNVTINP